MKIIVFLFSIMVLGSCAPKPVVDKSSTQISYNLESNDDSELGECLSIIDTELRSIPSISSWSITYKIYREKFGNKNNYDLIIYTEKNIGPTEIYYLKELNSNELVSKIRNLKKNIQKWTNLSSE